MWLIRVILVIALILGAVWIGQGVGLVGGSFMTGRREWAVIGSVLVCVAAPAPWWTSRPGAG